MQKLVIITHPDFQNSKVNKTWKHTLERYPETFRIHSIYDEYPDLSFDIDAEQELLSQFDEIIFQFPIHWFSTPFALKKYIDEILAFGWAFGPGGDRLEGKKIGFAVSTGGDIEAYRPPYGMNVDTLLNDVKLSFQFCGCTITRIHTFHGSMSNPSDGALMGNAREYIHSFMD